jgi:hypothetical protein
MNMDSSEANIENVVFVMRRNVSRNYRVITNYSYEDYVQMKEDMGWVNKDIADIVGFEHMSVKNQTQPKYDLPLWAQILVHLWKQENEGQLGANDIEKDVTDKLDKFKTAYREAKSNVKTLSERVEYLEKELRKAERKDAQRIEFIQQLDNLERKTDLTAKENISTTAIKKKLGKAASKHRRKIKILDKLNATIPKGVAKGEPKAKSQGSPKKEKVKA